ncbi:MAG: phosphatase PAP2 family protein [Oscillatoria sp. PMC 1051.18]|nr:phosphatase PAP2 family protein [Oscillatoria sp. PMC 1050.18]MEC5030133.1 phosphatase PAP2 family protein [Oscillatoria sp. PMC 1051.18]
MLLFNLRYIAKRIVRFWRRQLNRKNLFLLLSIIPLTGLIIAILGTWAFIEIADEVLEKQTQTLDRAILLAIDDWHRPVLTFLMQGFSIIGGTIVVTSIALGAGVFLWRRRQKVEFTALAITAIGGTCLNLLIKQFFDRSRPELWEMTNKEPRTSSFPSGHAMLSLIIYGFLGYLLASHYHRWRWWIAIGTILLVSIIGFSRLYLGIHWPTDVVAGQAAGLTWLAASILGLEIRWRRDANAAQ